jgi:hypothetical protein
MLSGLQPGTHLYDRRTGRERIVDRVERRGQVAFLSFRNGRTGPIDGRPASIADFVVTPDHPSCLLLVHPKVGRLAQAMDGLAAEYGWPRLSIGRELCTVLLSEPPRRHPRTARLWIKTRLRQMAPGPVLCTGVDLLFEPVLALDPLHTLCDASRVTRLVVAWPGSYIDDVLAYAVPDHGHYRTWRRPQVPIVVLEQVQARS